MYHSPGVRTPLDSDSRAPDARADG